MAKNAEAAKPKNTGQFGKGNPGKPKGALAKTTKTAKEAIALAAEGLGGADRLIAWAKEDALNERVFWGTIYPKLLPLQVNGPGEDGAHLFNLIERRIVKP
jgi:hypothetical protein